jgi:hypothetical protein
MEDADDEDIIPPVKEYEIKMEDTEDEVEVIIPVKKYKINDQILGVRTCRKVAKRTRPSFLPAAAAAENPTLTPLEDEDLLVAKRLRLRRQAPTSISTAADGVVNHAHTTDTATTDSADDTPTNPVSSAALLPSATTSRAPDRRPWTSSEDTMLMKLVKKYGKD